MRMRQKIRLPVCLIAGPAALTLLFFGPAAGQKQNPIPAQAEGIRGSEIDAHIAVVELQTICERSRA